MALIERLTRLFRADLHAVIDRLEEPDVLLRQALRDMEDELAQCATRLKASALEREQLQQRIGEIERTLAGIGTELDLCFAAGNDALIRTLLRRRLEGERLLQLLAQRTAAAARRIEEGGTQLAERQRALEALRQRIALLEAGAMPRGPAVTGGFDDAGVSEADIDLALLRERELRRTP
jgi:phage shock protein A